MFKICELESNNNRGNISDFQIPDFEYSYLINFDNSSIEYIRHHQVFNKVIVPSTVFLEFLLSIGRKFLKLKSILISDFLIHNPLFLKNNDELDIYVLVEPTSLLFEIFTISGDVHKSSSGLIKVKHVTGHLSSTEEESQILNSFQLDLESKRRACRETSISNFYISCQERRIHYGYEFRVIRKLWLGSNESLSYIEIDIPADSQKGSFQVDPVLLDGCLQTLWSVLPQESAGITFLPLSIQSLKLYMSPPSKVWSYVRLSDEQSSDQIAYTADIYVVDEKGNLFISLEEVLVHKVAGEIVGQSSESTVPIAIASTYTAEPIADSLRFWMQKLELPYQCDFAPYNQVFQALLKPDSVFGQNHDGVNVILARLEDWDCPEATLQLQVDDAVQNQILANQPIYTLPNRWVIAHLNQYESEYLYQEIFVDKVYAKHGIVLEDSDCVVDVGANIGLFTLFAQQQCPNGSIYSFEPAPHTFDKLQCNTKLYCQNVHIFNCGLSSENRTENFTFYPNSSVFSSFSADVESDEKAIRAVILNMLQRDGSLSAEDMDALADQFLSDRLKCETYQAPLRTLSSVIEEHGIEQIDLLKLDAEKSELPVLLGIKDEHWAMIRQIVVEVHDQVGDIIAEVKHILQVKGFNWVIDEEDLLQSSGLYNIYATRTATSEVTSETVTHQGAELERNIEDFCAALRTATARTAAPYIVCLCPSSATMMADAIRQARYHAAEVDLSTKLQNISGVHLLDSTLLTQTYAVSKYDDPHGQEFGKVPYTLSFFAALGTSIARTLHATQRHPYKVIVLDCDNTLWQGICGEEGAEGICVDAPYQALQEWMLAQQQSGMLLCLCSKNNPADVWAVFDQVIDMPLQRKHIVQAKINWQPKSENIRALAAELKLGLDSFIFIDDNPVECAEVQANCPAVLSLQLPAEPSQIPQFLEHIWAFDQQGTTAEDQQRSALYQQNIQREQFRQETLTFADFLAELNLQISISPLTATQLPRISQLTQRTNQFNFTTIRCSESEIQQLCKAEEHECWIVSLRDRFGDYGIVGALLFKAADAELQVHSFLLSCRALGRGVEYQMLAKLGEIAQAQGCKQVNVPYIPTSKNQPALNFLNTVGGDFKRVIDTGYQFLFPAELAAQLIYTPEAQPADLQDGNASSESAIPKTHVYHSNRQLTQTLNHIATELFNPEQILEVIVNSQQRVRPQLEAAYVAPTNQIETELAKIWADVLGLAEVGVHDNFFELGGRSLLMVQVHSQLREQFADSDISPVELFKYPTIHSLAQRLQRAAPEQPVALTQASERAKQRQEARAQRQQRRGRRNG